MEHTDLDRINRIQIQRAGPRYAPGLNPDAPNLPIDSVLLSVGALAADEYFVKHVRGLQSDVLTTWRRLQRGLAAKYYKGIKSTPAAVADALEELAVAPLGNRLGPSRLVSRVSSRAHARLTRLVTSLYGKELAAPDNDKRRRVGIERWNLEVLQASLQRVTEFIDAPAFSSITSNRLILLGEWGTGKTHLLCDVTKRRMELGLPTLLYLAKDLPRDVEPLQGLCDATVLAESPRELLQCLQALGEQSGTMSLLIVDGINENDRGRWRRAVSQLSKVVQGFTHVGIVLSCRRPFDVQIFADVTRRKWVEINHPGFVDVEFDAQLEFFSYYDIPAPDIPLLTPEFSRPLFLRLMCETIHELSHKRKNQYLRSIASGQKGMTKLLEDFVKNVAISIEDEFGVRRGLCWELLKGHTVTGRLIGIAPLMADSNRDSIMKAECLDIISQITSNSNPEFCNSFLERLLAEGLLINQLRWDGGQYTEDIQLPYQRFSDHLIARHLLERYLHTTTEAAVRRSFYINRPLGRIFELYGHEFVKPGLASAIMIEFPERVKRANLPNDDRELVFYLPERCRRVAPLQSVFLEGLYWRNADSFSRATDHIMSIYLNHSAQLVRSEALEVLTALATRPDHPYSPSRLSRYLAEQSMADRDLSWSEYLRTADSESVVYRILEWVERKDNVLNRHAAEKYLTLLPLLLTTTRRHIRDRATRSLFLIGGSHPGILFKKTLAFLGFPDPYVSERMLAACYGVTMSYWADPQYVHVTDAMPKFARALYRQMFAPQAPNATAHALKQDYALGVIKLAQRLAPQTLAKNMRKHIDRPLQYLKSPFPAAHQITDDEFESAECAFRMDFENYTLGRLVKDRRAYDYADEDYSSIRRRIRWRVNNLGFSHSRFDAVDRLIERSSSHGRGDHAKVDRYGKKYSWIAFFEMYGVLFNQGLLPEGSDHRPSDIDIDPSFPLVPRTWIPQLSDPLDEGPTNVIDWVSHGPAPDYEHILKLEEIDGVAGPWLLLDGYIAQGQKGDDRFVFTFLRGLLVNRLDLPHIFAEFNNVPYPGNEAIPDPSPNLRMFAAEIPGSLRFTNQTQFQRGVSKRQLIRVFEIDYGDVSTGVQAELPVAEFSWESGYSLLNEAINVTVPSPALCERLALVNRARQFDLYDSSGVPASICIFYRQGPVDVRLLYMREDLLNRYANDTRQTLCWLVWGERVPTGEAAAEFRYEIPSTIYRKNAHIHKRSYVWRGRVQEIRKKPWVLRLLCPTL